MALVLGLWCKDWKGHEDSVSESRKDLKKTIDKVLRNSEEIVIGD